VTRSGSSDRRLIRRPGGLLAAGAVFALGLAAVGVHAAAGATLRGPGLQVGVSILLALAFAAAALTVAGRYRGHVRTADVANATLDRLRQATVAVLFASAVLVPIALILLHRPLDGTGQLQLPTVPTAPGSGSRSAEPVAPTHRPHPGHTFNLNLTAVLLTLLAVLGVAVLVGLIAFAVWLLRRTPPLAPVEAAPPTDAPDPADEALAEALLAGRRALSGDDARTAIIACYAAMEASLDRAGVAREAADSPSDLLRRAKIRDFPGTAGHDAVALTELFREARFSTHPMNAQHMDTARRAMDSVTEALAERIRAAEGDAETAAAGVAPR
jgi:hypothetical protein